MKGQERPSDRIRAAVRATMKADDVSPAGIGRREGLAPHVVRTMLRGHEPNIDAADAICHAVRTTLYIGSGEPAARLASRAGDQRISASARLRKVIREAARRKTSLRKAERDGER